MVSAFAIAGGKLGGMCMVDNDGIDGAPPDAVVGRSLRSEGDVVALGSEAGLLGAEEVLLVLVFVSLFEPCC